MDKVIEQHSEKIRGALSCFDRVLSWSDATAMGGWGGGWYCNGMRTTMDGGGRVVVPRALRQQLGLQPGMDLDITDLDGALLLSPAPVPMKLVRRGKGLVAEAATPLPKLTAAKIRAAIEASRR